MNILYALIVFSCLMDIFSTSCLARRKRPAYLTPAPEGVHRHKKPLLVSPFIKKITQKNKRLAKQLQKIEFQGQQEITRSEKHARKLQKEFASKQIKLEKEKAMLVTQLQKQHQTMMKRFQEQLNKKLYDGIKQLSQQTDKKLVQLKKETEKKEADLVTRARKETLRKISQAEMQLIENYLGAKHKTTSKNPKKFFVQRDFIPDTSDQILATWKKTKQKELDDVVAHLGPILSSDEELAQMLANKKMTIATNITDTQKIEDESYNAVMNDLKPLLLVHKTQKDADKLVEEELQTMAISQKNRQNIRFILLAELQPHIQQAVDTGQEILPEKIQSLVTQTVAEVQQKPTPIMPLPTPEPQPQPVVDETLRKQLAMLEEKLHETQKKNSLYAQQTDATINELKQSLEQLKKENLSLQILAQQTEEKLAQAEQLDGKALHQLQAELASMKESLNAQSKKQLKLEVLFEQNKNELMQATLSEQKKQHKIENLERALEESKQNIKTVQSLQNQLARLTRKQKEKEKAHQIKKAIFTKQQTQLQHENIDLQKQAQENVQLQNTIKQLAIQAASARDDANKARIRQKITIKKQVYTQSL